MTLGATPPITPVIFYSQSAMSLIYYADAIESDSTAGDHPHFGDVAERAWKTAGKELAEFGRKDLASPYGGFIHLDALDQLVAKEKQIETRLQEIMPGEFEKLIDADKKTLTKEELTALETPLEKRDGGQQTIAFIFWQHVAEQTAPEHRGEALNLASQFEKIEIAARDIRSSREIVNYNYWKTRCEAEPTAAALKARELTYQADREKQEARPLASKKLYEQAFGEWRKVLDQFQVLHDDTLMAQDLAEIIDRYRDTLRQLAGDDAKFPEHFVLQDMLDVNERMNGPPKAKLPEKTTPAKGETKPEKKPAAEKETKPKGETKADQKPAAEEQSKSDKQPAESGAKPEKDPPGKK